jgi:arylsulfatase A-like enzyme
MGAWIAKTAGELLMRIVRLIAALMILFNVVAAAAGTPRPNIVLVMADDLGYGDVGWHGGPYQTPHLDQLAKASVRLEQHYSLPVCSPTRSALLSGRFNSRFGCTNPTNDRVFPFDTTTLASALRSVGYETALIGKWHLGSKTEWGPQKYGFDHSYGSLAGGVTSYSHVYKTGPFAETWHRNGTLIEEEGHVTDLLTREAVQFIEKKRSGPFFLYVPYTAVHLPIDEPKEWLDRYASETDLGIRQYGACVSHLDDGVGKILAALDRTGARANTIVLFISDNGGSTGTQNNDPKYAGTHPTFNIPARNGLLRGKKGTVYEGGIRTPGIISWPGHLKARDEHSPIHVADWFPTLAAVVGYRPQADLKWDGSDRWPVLTGTAKPGLRTLYWLGPGGNSLALRHGDLVLVQQKGKPDELYDLNTDPGQKQDLAAKRPQTIQELTVLLKKVRERDNDAKVQ